VSEQTSFHGECPACDVLGGRFMQFADYRDPAKLATWLHHISHLWRPHGRHHAFGPGAWQPYHDGFMYLRPQLCTPNTRSGSMPAARVRAAASAEAAAQAVDVADLEKGRLSPGVYLQTAGHFSSYCTCVPCVKKMLKAIAGT
jgi:hypothetical protein